MLKTTRKSQNDIFEHIKQKIAIETVANDLGLNLSKQNNDLVGNCPTGHQSNSGKCFHINTKNNLCYCFNCNKGGSVIDLVMMSKSIDIPETLKWFNDKYSLGYELNKYSPLTEKELAERSKKETEALLYEAIFDYGKSMLFEDEGKDVLQYLTTKRRYNLEKIKNMELIYFPKTSVIKDHLREMYPNAEDEIAGLKLNGHFGDNFRLAFPYRNLNGQITGFVKRSINPQGESITTYDGKKHENVRFDSTPGLNKDDLFGLHKIKGTETILIVEGYMDAMYFFELGQKNIVAVGQGRLSERHLIGLQSKNIKNVIISFDNDSVGPDNTQSAIELLLKHTKIKSFVIDPSRYGEYKDPDEFIRRNDFSDFRIIYNNAIDGIEWMIKKLANEESKLSEIQKLELFEKVSEIAKFTLSRDNKNLIISKLAKILGTKESDVKQKIGNLNSRTEFWYHTENGIAIDNSEYFKFINNLGFYKYYTGTNYRYVKIENNLVTESSEPIIKDAIKAWADAYESEDNIKEFLLSNHTKYLSDGFLELIPPINIEFKKDESDAAYIYFKNCYVKVNKNGRHEILDYSNLDSPIWESNLIKRELKLITHKNRQSEFEQFIWNISKQDENKMLSICSAIGYLLHDYKVQSNAKAIVFFDEKLSRSASPEGRSGKSLIGKAIEKMKNCTIVDGKNFIFKPSFTFQQVTLSTKVINFNDVKQDFNFENLFSAITDGMTVEYKNKTPFEIPFADSPKFLISTNYAINGFGSSYADRLFEIGITDFYNLNHKPKDDFGHEFFTEWSDQEWNLFYNFMIECIELYLNYGLISASNPTLVARKIINETSIDFYDFAESSIALNKEYNKKTLYHAFKASIGFDNDLINKCPVKQNTFTKYVEAYAALKGYEYKDRGSNGKYYFTLRDR